ncbi:hypothetical protein C8J56DRAFT_802504 [Mycena floridula]|nr:hypothetical protein C8J56DRAFT_802504 [Mycena floridula]
MVKHDETNITYRPSEPRRRRNQQLLPVPPQSRVLCGASNNNRTGIDARARGGVWYGQGNNQNTAVEIPERYEQSDYTGTLLAVMKAVEQTHKDTELEIVIKDRRLSKILTSKIPSWEDKGYSGVKDPSLMRSLVAKIRGRVAKTFVTVGSGMDVEPACSLSMASLLADGNVPITQDLDLRIPEQLHLRGAKLSDMTQSRAYRMIRATKKVKPRKTTLNNIKLVKTAIRNLNGDAPDEAKIWHSIRTTDFMRRQRNFLYMTMHGAHKIGAFWKNVQDCETWGICQHCQVTESMEHILLECRRPGQSQLWNLAHLLWSQRNQQNGVAWPDMTLGLILGCGLVHFTDGTGKYRPALSRFFRILVTETVHTIWKIRCSTVLNRNNVAMAVPQVHNMWVHSMNERLKIDRSLTSVSRYGKKALPVKTVLDTWSGALRDEASLPDSWIWEPRVLVGVEPMTNHRVAVPRPPGRRGRNR